MTKLTLTRVFTTDKNKDGTPLMSKAGKPYTKMSIKAKEYGDKWISGFKNKQNEGWKDGDIVEAIIKENGEYLNFELPKKDDVVTGEIGKIHNLLTGMNLVLLQIAEKVGINTYSPDGKYKTNTGKPLGDVIEYPDAEINADDIPF